MKVFISWSGDRSRRLAEAIREWLPNVLQAVDPWMSAEDIEKGTRWSTDIANQLEKTKAGILCVTPDNLGAPWLHFEAGALSKTLDKTFVSPYLLNLRPSDLKGPLVQFQATEATKPDTRKLVGTLNKALAEDALTERQLDKTFEIWWPELALSLQELPPPKAPRRVQRSEREILEEILALVRDQAKRRIGEGYIHTGEPEREPLYVFGPPRTGESYGHRSIPVLSPTDFKIYYPSESHEKPFVGTLIDEEKEEEAEQEPKEKPKRKPGK